MAAVAAALFAGLMLGGMVTPFVMVVDLFPADLIGTALGACQAIRRCYRSRYHRAVADVTGREARAARCGLGLMLNRVRTRRGTGAAGVGCGRGRVVASA